MDITSGTTSNLVEHALVGPIRNTIIPRLVDDDYWSPNGGAFGHSLPGSPKFTTQLMQRKNFMHY
jgi:hypothetical protein